MYSLGTVYLIRPSLASISRLHRNIDNINRQGSIVRSANQSRLRLLSSDKHHQTSHRFLSSQSQSVTDRRGGPIDIYRDRISKSILLPDEHQLGIVKLLQELYDRLADYEPPEVVEELEPKRNLTFFDKLFQKTRGGVDVSLVGPSGSIKGLYLFGSVGTGKSMLMDMFYDSLPNLRNDKLTFRRIHFHQFMFNIHNLNHQHQKDSSVRNMSFSQSEILELISRRIAIESRILCFDEFQVTDIVDAMILKKLLESMISNGVIFIITSNRHPDELYKNGIQRESFIPCIELLKSHLKIRDLTSPNDYRKQKSLSSSPTSAKAFLSPITPNNKSEFLKQFETLTIDQSVVEGRSLNVWGRTLIIPKSTTEIAYFDFDQLCNKALSASDYLEIVKNFRVIFLDDVPKLTISQRDLARRFILFIDTAYESKTKLFILSEVPIFEIFSDEKSHNSKEKSDYQKQDLTNDDRSTIDDLGLDLKSVADTSLFSGEEEMFAWKRAVSRLNEMQTFK
ncbi:AFG1-like ATPase [Phakopsora pachyrhizi]|nr:AFG1-like ATPase [Phakopsora pachyrhizi]